ncbi:hypothetical protein ACLEX4_01660 [Pseudescherichia vulneris]
MIGRITPLPSFSNKCINHNNDTHPKKILKNQKTGSVINVKNTNCDFRIISKELSLCRDVKNNPMLASVANTKSHYSLNARFSSLGVAVTAIYNMIENGKAKEKSVDICDKNPRNQLMKLNLDPSLTTRGVEYINQFIDTETPLDSTNYAIGLKVGSDIKNAVLNRIMINQFNSTWNIRLNMAQKK